MTREQKIQRAVVELMVRVIRAHDDLYEGGRMLCSVGLAVETIMPQVEAIIAELDTMEADLT